MKLEYQTISKRSSTIPGPGIVTTISGVKWILFCSVHMFPKRLDKLPSQLVVINHSVGVPTLKRDKRFHPIASVRVTIHNPKLQVLFHCA